MQASRFRSDRATSLLQSVRASGCAKPLPSTADARSHLKLPQDNLGGVSSRKHSLGSLQDASFKARRLARNCPTTIGAVPASKCDKSFPEQTLSGHFALRERAGKLGRRSVPPSPQTQLDLVPAWAYNNELSQLRAEIMTLQEAVRELADRSFSKSKADNTNNNNNDTNTNNDNNNNNNNDDNNDNNNNKTSQRSSLQSLDQSKRCQETGLNSFDLDIENPESSFGSDLDRESLDSFASTGEATSLPNLGTTMAIGFSLGSLTQDNQIGEQAGTHWDPSLEMDRDSFGRQKPKKKVRFSTATLEAYKAECQHDRQQNSQLRQLESNNKNCSNNNLQQAWQHSPSKMQQQPATAYEKMAPKQGNAYNSSLDHEEANLEEEDRALGSLEAQLPATRAFGSPKQNNNTSNLGQDLKNKAAWGILIDTGAAMSLAPVSFVFFLGTELPLAR